MKKMWMLILAAALLLSLVACSNSTGDTSAQNYHVGETVSTDIVDFTLNDCALSIYANEMGNEGFLKPAEGGNIYGAKVGSSLIIPSFTVTNKDRSGSINIEDTGGDLNLNWVVRYNGKKYNVTQFDLNSDGISGMSLSSAAIIDPDSGDMIEKNDTSNYLLDAGKTVSFRTIGIIGVEPETLNDEFEITITLPSSSGEKSFTYIVAER